MNALYIGPMKTNSTRDTFVFFFPAGTDENRIIRLLTDHNNAERQELITKYKTCHGRVSIAVSSIYS